MSQISLVVADLDGTLLDPGKTLSVETLRAVHALHDAGILFTVISGRPPFGMRMAVDLLDIRLPISGFNGGMITDAGYETLHKHTLASDTSRKVAAFLESKGLKYWVYHGSDWLVLDPNLPHEEKEAHNVGFTASRVQTLEGRWEGLTKITAISDDPERLAGIEREMQEEFRGRASAARSQPYYLDITHAEASKGFFVDYLSGLHSIPKSQIATIGDMPSDVSMFDRCGLGIAMGNASQAVKSAANRITSTNGENGFARAMDELVLDTRRDTRRKRSAA
jgi:hypothetical protein